MKNFLKFTLASVVGVFIAGFLIISFFIASLSTISSVLENPTPSLKDKSILVMKLDQSIVERTTKDPFRVLRYLKFYSSEEIGLNDILANIKKAKKDEKIRGIYLNPVDLTCGYATVEEIRNALIDFKKSGKFIYAYGEVFSQKAYYLVSVADKIIMNPQGMLEFKGLSARMHFYKGAMDKLGVDMQVIRHGKFKAAMEPFMREDMSKENKLQTYTYMNSIWKQILNGISESRNISVDKLNKLADEVTTFRTTDYLKKEGLIDTVMYKDQVLSDLKKKVRIEDDEKLRTIGLSKYSDVPVMTDGRGLAKEKVAIIYASGEIGITSGGYGENIDYEELSLTIREARQDTSINAIVLRINSPGGSAYGSEVIWREVKLAAEAKPFIVSMGDYAASGGYYIAAAADTIMADHTTITGSIGIFGTVPNAQTLLKDKMGITEDWVNTNKNSNFLSATRPMTTFEKEYFQKYIEIGYNTFISRVAEGRNMTKAQVDSIGQGRVWSSENAMKNGLVDLYGGIGDAVKLAAKNAGLKRYRIVSLPKIKDPVEQFLNEIYGNVSIKILKSKLGSQFKLYEEMNRISQMKGMYARIPFNLEIN